MSKPLGDVPVVLNQPVRRVSSGLVEQGPEFFAVFRMQSACECQGVETVTVNTGDTGQRIEKRTVGAISS